MPKRELNIPIDKQLNTSTKEDLIFRSPPPIPDPGLRDLVQMGRINGSDCSYYDIAPTEPQAISDAENINLNLFGPLSDINPLTGFAYGLQEIGERPQPIDEQDILDKFEIIMGEHS